MAGAVESLNVAMAGTVLAFEAARQRAGALTRRSAREAAGVEQRLRAFECLGRIGAELAHLQDEALDRGVELLDGSRGRAPGPDARRRWCPCAACSGRALRVRAPCSRARRCPARGGGRSRAAGSSGARSPAGRTPDAIMRDTWSRTCSYGGTPGRGVDGEDHDGALRWRRVRWRRAPTVAVAAPPCRAAAATRRARRSRGEREPAADPTPGCRPTADVEQTGIGRECDRLRRRQTPIHVTSRPTGRRCPKSGRPRERRRRVTSARPAWSVQVAPVTAEEREAAEQDARCTAWWTARTAPARSAVVDPGVLRVPVVLRLLDDPSLQPGAERDGAERDDGRRRCAVTTARPRSTS